MCILTESSLFTWEDVRMPHFLLLAAGANVEWMAFSTWRDFNALMRRHTGCGLDEPSPLQVRRVYEFTMYLSPCLHGHV